MVYGGEQESDRIHWERHVDAVEERRAMSSSTPLARSARLDSQRFRNRKPSNPESVATWMKYPIDGDASWAPIPPPKSSPRPHGSVKSPSPLAPPRQTREASPKVLVSGDHMHSDVIPTPNPVSSSDSSSSSELPISQERGRTTDRAALLQTQGSQSTSRRGRSRTSRNPTERGRSPSASKQSNSHHQARGRSESRGHSIERARSTSRSKATERPRSTSRTRVNNVNTSSNTVHPISNKSAARRSRSVSHTPQVSRGRSQSRPRSSSKPPSTSRTRAQYHAPSSSNSVGPGLPPRHCRANRASSDDGITRASDTKIGRDISFGRTATTPARTVAASRS